MKQGAGIALSFVIMIIVSFIDYNWIFKIFLDMVWNSYCHAYRCLVMDHTVLPDGLR